MPGTIELSARTARRFILGKQGLWPGRRWHGIDGTRQAMRAGEYIQLDPLVILARSHDLVLHSRVAGYQPEYFDALVYQQREFFEWGGWLAVRPMEELPHWRVVMRREHDHVDMLEIAKDHAGALDEVRAALRARGTVSNADFTGLGAPALQHYRGSRPTSLALYYLWRTGETMTHHRERFQRIYAPAEAVAPPHLLFESPELEADLFLVRKAVAFAGIGRAHRAGMPLRRLLGRPTTRAGQLELEHMLLDAHQLVPVRVEGSRETQLVLSEDIQDLEAIERDRVPAAWAVPPGIPAASFLSPLDPVTARSRAAALFGFEYLWEIYMPADKVKFGRYTLPILWGDCLAGRIDMKVDRRRNALIVNGLWFEESTTHRDEDFRRAFGAEMGRLQQFLGTKTLDATALPRPLRPLCKP